MKRVLIIFGFCMLAMGLHAASHADMIKAARGHYEAGDFAKSAEVYEEVLAQEVESWQLYYNLGNAYFKQKAYGHAILNYERAMKLNPDDEDLKANLTHARAFSKDKFEEVEEQVVSVWYRSLVNVLGSNGWATISLVSFILFLIAIGLFLYLDRNNIKRGALGLGALLILLAMICFFFATQQKSWAEMKEDAIVLAPQVEVLTSPQKDATTSFVIHEGTKVKVLENVNGWKRIKLSDGKDGWCPEKAVEEI